MDRAVVFIDGGYIDKINMNLYGYRRILLDRLSDEICKPDCVRFRTYYYHCPPHQDDPPTEDQRRRKAGYDKFVGRLREKPRFMIREGRLRVVSRDPPVFEQKGVDVLFACDLVRLAATHTVNKAIIISGDSDFVPAVAIAKEEMVLTSLWYAPGHCSPHLWTICDERNALTQELIDSVSEQRKPNDEKSDNQKD